MAHFFSCPEVEVVVLAWLTLASSRPALNVVLGV